RMAKTRGLEPLACRRFPGMLFLLVSVLCSDASTAPPAAGAAPAHAKSQPFLRALGPYPPSLTAAGDYRSPDRRYLARALQEAPDTVTLTLYEIRSGMIVLQEDVDTFVWVLAAGH